jgi:3-hydroxy-9,10-secoandrosta-1,3,5(10)-triene-9,17-dione monooxygenase reductase component
MSAGPAADADGRSFRDLMGRWATGVAIVTAHHEGRDAGLTVNALLSVSLAPPSLLISLTVDADTTPVVQRSGAFAVNFLAADQQPLSARFAQTVPASEKFRSLSVHRGTTGAALLDGTLGACECRVASWTPTYDHVLILGEVVRQEVGREGPPLIFYRSGYAVADGMDRVRLPGPKG